MTAGVYRVHCLKSDVFYVGETINLHKRIVGEHLPSLRAGRHENSHLQRAWNKYGEQNFRFEIVWECPCEVSEVLSRADLSGLTRRMEATVGGAMLDAGMCLYNTTPFHTWSKGNPSTSAEVRALQVEAGRRRWMCEAARAKASKDRLDFINANPGTANRTLAQLHAASRTPDERARRSERLKKRWKDDTCFQRLMSSKMHSGANPSSRRVVCLETGEVFACMADASRSIGLSPNAVSTAIWAGKRCGDYTWQRLEE